MQRAKDYGLKAGDRSPTISRRWSSARAAWRSSSIPALAHLMKKNKMTVVHMGEARLPGPTSRHRQEAKKAKRSFTAKHVIVATGARARDLPGLEADGKRVWTYQATPSMPPPEMPKKLLVIGSGAIGIEFASFYNATSAPRRPWSRCIDRVVPVEDADDVRIPRRRRFEKQGMTILTKRRGRGPQPRHRQGASRRKIKARTARRETMRVQPLSLSAIGIVPNTENIGLEKLGREDGPERHGDRRLLPLGRSRRALWAIGDCHERPVARAQGQP
jgi:dihydrolipoamide dehydrogenase